MKKRILCITLILVMIVVTLASCGNRDVFDTVKTYDYAIISMPDGSVVEGKVQNWRDYDDSDQIQVKIDEKTYLVHSSNVCLIAE